MGKMKVIIEMKAGNLESIMLGIGKETIPIPAKDLHMKVTYIDMKTNKIKVIEDGISEFIVEVDEKILQKVHEHGHWYLFKCFLCGARKRG
jgi:hypothetical protein